MNVEIFYDRNHREQYGARGRSLYAFEHGNSEAEWLDSRRIDAYAVDRSVLLKIAKPSSGVGTLL